MKGVSIVYSDQELEFIKVNSLLVRSKLHKMFCDKFERDVTLSNINSLCKRNNWMTGRTGCYKKGNIPHPNAGPKGPNKTSFKAGHSPHNCRPIGSTRIDKDGYTEVKIKEPRTWKTKQTINWEKENGKVPSGFVVSFIDGDKENTKIENLELISRNENLQINRLHCSSQPAEIKPTVKVLGKLIAKTIEISK